MHLVRRCLQKIVSNSCRIRNDPTLVRSSACAFRYLSTTSPVASEQGNNLAAVNSLQSVDNEIVDTLIEEKSSTHGSTQLGTYVVSHLREHPVLKEAREHANAMGPLQAMQISAEEGAVLQIFVRMMNAQNCIEVGFFTGYSALAVALAMPDDGRITAIDIQEEWAAQGEAFFEQAGVRHKLDLRIQNGQDALKELLQEKGPNSFDFGFIDADKTGYLDYYESLLQLVRPGGVICIDNVFWLDRVAKEEYQDEDTNAIRALNDFMATDNRIELAYLPTADGVALCYVK